jgi:hypothetical protein
MQPGGTGNPRKVITKDKKKGNSLKMLIFSGPEDKLSGLKWYASVRAKDFKVNEKSFFHTAYLPTAIQLVWIPVADIVRREQG